MYQQIIMTFSFILQMFKSFGGLFKGIAAFGKNAAEEQGFAEE